MVERKKRGGQPGNRNAMKHGFYSRGFEEIENQDLLEMAEDGIASEINLFRVLIRRLFEFTNNDAENEDLLPAFEALGDAMVKLAGMMRTQQMLTGESSSMSSALTTALNEVCSDLRLK